jgi:hypothetical protein
MIHSKIANYAQTKGTSLTSSNVIKLDPLLEVVGELWVWVC